MLSPELMEILRCPKCRGVLEQQTATPEGLTCQACRLLYTVQDGIPNMLIEEARPLGEIASAAAAPARP